MASLGCDIFRIQDKETGVKELSAVNSLVVLPQEVIDPTRARLEGARALYAFETHGVRDGQTIKVCVLGGLRGEAKVLSATTSSVVLELNLSLPSLEPIPFSLLVGVSRPQTVKKVIQAAVMFGVSSLHFVRSELGEKSYLQSRSLDSDQIEEETVKALEQVWDSRAPEIVVHRTFSYFMENKLAGIAASLEAQTSGLRAQGFVAHPGGARLRCSDAARLKDSPAIIAIGPERGWSDAEVRAFAGSGFQVVGLGDRVVRVELALVFLMGTLAPLRA